MLFRSPNYHSDSIRITRGGAIRMQNSLKYEKFSLAFLINTKIVFTSAANDSSSTYRPVFRPTIPRRNFLISFHLTADRATNLCGFLLFFCFCFAAPQNESPRRAEQRSISGLSLSLGDRNNAIIVR